MLYHLLVILNSFCHFFGIFSSVLALDLVFFGDPPTSISSVNDFRHAISCSLKTLSQRRSISSGCPSYVQPALARSIGVLCAAQCK